MNLPDKVVMLHQALRTADIKHAFGGALALAWCTQQARGTIDIDLNVFVDAEDAELALNALPEQVAWSEADVKEIRKAGQVRLWWESTPVDLFLNTLKLHRHMSRRIRFEEFGSTAVPFLACRDIAVLKAFFNRTKDWADLEAMVEAGTINVPQVMATIIEYLGQDDERVAKLAAIDAPTR